jgi:hypothetical protein
VRCGKQIHPLQPFEMGHVDGDPTRYAGPEHRKCNRSTTSRRREPVVVPAGCFPRDVDGEVVGWTSRQW